MTTDIEFKAWPKTPRLFRGMTITEKIDGTNAAVIVTEDGRVGAQSRNRLVTPDADNVGFAAWVESNANELAAILGAGHHYGEWWGSKIQRGYGLTNGERRFSLFNVRRYEHLVDLNDVPGLDVVPTLFEGAFSQAAVGDTLAELAKYGSTAAPGYMHPEGVIVHLAAANQVFKATLDNDGQPKSAVA